MASIGENAFGNATSVVKKGTRSLLALWKAGYTPVEDGTGAILKCPSMTLLSTTQTTSTWELNTLYEDYSYYFEMEDRSGKKIKNGEVVTIKDLLPRNTYTMALRIYYKDYEYRHYDFNYSCTTMPIYISIQSSSTASSIHLKGECLKGDANVEETMQVKDMRTEKATVYVGPYVDLTGLQPEETYEIMYLAKAVSEDGMEKTDTVSSILTTKSLFLQTLQPRVFSSGNVIVAAESNLDDEEVNVGFEWRRTDWDDQFDSRTGGAYLYEGTMEGYIRNLNAEKLWKFRPYYKSEAGEYYYGEWVGLDPSDTSYFDPTVHTYAKISVEGNQAQVKGYAMRGSDKVVEQGFKYWKVGAATAKVRTETSTERAEAPALAVAVPASALTAAGTGEVMEVALTGLDYNSEYVYVAFVTTAEGDTFYGEERSFTTGENPSGIETVPLEEAQGTNTPATVVARYNMNGQKISTPQPGINILHMSDGTARKVLIK